MAGGLLSEFIKKEKREKTIAFWNNIFGKNIVPNIFAWILVFISFYVIYKAITLDNKFYVEKYKIDSIIKGKENDFNGHFIDTYLIYYYDKNNIIDNVKLDDSTKFNIITRNFKNGDNLYTIKHYTDTFIMMILLSIFLLLVALIHIIIIINR